MVKKTDVLLFIIAIFFGLGINFAFAEEGLYFQDLSVGSSRALELLNNYEPKDLEAKDGWRPLTKEEFSEKKVEMAFKIAGATAELMDSLYLSYASKGLFSIIDAGIKVREYSEKLKEDYHLNFKVKEDRASLVFSFPY